MLKKILEQIGMSTAKRMRRHREVRKVFTCLLGTRHHFLNAATNDDCVVNLAFWNKFAPLPSPVVSSTMPLSETDHFDGQTASSPVYYNSQHFR